jgi:hypothetical protein
MDIIAHGFEIAITAAMNQERLIAARKEVAKLLVPSIEADRVSAQQPLHPWHQVGLRRFNDQMKVVGH